MTPRHRPPPPQTASRRRDHRPRPASSSWSSTPATCACTPSSATSPSAATPTPASAARRHQRRRGGQRTGPHPASPSPFRHPHRHRQRRRSTSTTRAAAPPSTSATSTRPRTQLVADPDHPLPRPDGHRRRSSRATRSPSPLTVESRFAAWDRPLVRRYNNADQQTRYPGDKGLEFVEQTAEKQIVWGAKLVRVEGWEVAPRRPHPGRLPRTVRVGQQRLRPVVRRLGPQGHRRGLRRRLARASTPPQAELRRRSARALGFRPSRPSPTPT